jgi:hypothetical protein
MLLIYDRQDDYDTATPERIDEVMKQHYAFHDFMVKRGSAFSNQALQQPNTATALRQTPEGNWLITDGPFPDTKEVVGGFYIFDARDLDEAIDIAKHCPAIVGLELRPIVDFSQIPT